MFEVKFFWLGGSILWSLVLVFWGGVRVEIMGEKGLVMGFMLRFDWIWWVKVLVFFFYCGVLMVFRLVYVVWVRVWFVRSGWDLVI